MHDPQTVAFDIRWPWWWMKYRPSFITVWHVDPETDGSDDSCGWFIRSRHADQSVLERIVKRFEFDFDRTFHSDGGRVYLCGLFAPNGEPHFSVPGVVLNLFFMAAMEHFQSNGRSNWRKSRQFMQRNLFDILHFAENTTDSLFDGLTRKFEIGCSESYTPQRREERIRQLAGTVYSWILRNERPWWRHPKWHVHHWKLQIHPIQQFKRWAFSRCCKCGKRFRWGESVTTTNWHSDGPRWFRSEPDIFHSNCDGEGSQVATSEGMFHQ